MRVVISAVNSPRSNSSAVSGRQSMMRPTEAGSATKMPAPSPRTTDCEKPVQSCRATCRLSVGKAAVASAMPKTPSGNCISRLP